MLLRGVILIMMSCRRVDLELLMATCICIDYGQLRTCERVILGLFVESCGYSSEVVQAVAKAL